MAKQTEDEDPTLMQVLCDSANRLIVAVIPFVVLFLIWPQLARIEKQATEANSKIEKLSAELDSMRERIGRMIDGKLESDESWEKSQKFLNQSE